MLLGTGLMILPFVIVCERKCTCEHKCVEFIRWWLILYMILVVNLLWLGIYGGAVLYLSVKGRSQEIHRSVNDTEVCAPWIAYTGIAISSGSVGIAAITVPWIVCTCCVSLYRANRFYCALMCCICVTAMCITT